MLLDSLRVTALGLNCGLGGRGNAPAAWRRDSPKVTNRAADVLSRTRVFRALRPDARCFPAGPEEFASLSARPWRKAGAWLLGGCCGTTPAHISRHDRRLCGSCPLRRFRQVSPGNVGVLRQRKPFVWSKAPIVIGERINPTGKKKMKEALRDRGRELSAQGSRRVNPWRGLHVLDVNVGLPADRRARVDGKGRGRHSGCVRLSPAIRQLRPGGTRTGACAPTTAKRWSTPSAARKR